MDVLTWVIVAIVAVASAGGFNAARSWIYPDSKAFFDSSSADQQRIFQKARRFAAVLLVLGATVEIAWLESAS